MRTLQRFVRPAGVADGERARLPGGVGSRRPPAPGEACELCGEAVTPGHRHAVDLETRSLACLCRACVLLLDVPGAGGDRYGMIPTDHHRIDSAALPPKPLARLGVPVGMAFLLPVSDLERTVAFYPSPAGATESVLDLEEWDELVAAAPELGEVRPDVEAALVREHEGTTECFVVPIDRCYELVGRLRIEWRGFDGGAEVRRLVEEFFADLHARCTPPTASGGSPLSPTTDLGLQNEMGEGR